MAYPFRNLVFEGGGVKGIAYVGALTVLETKGIVGQIERAGGTSAGAINAVLLALDYKLAEMEKILGELDFRKFMDDSFGLLRDARRLVNEFGWHKGEFFYEWIAGLIKDKTGNANSTFDDLRRSDRYRDLYLIGANISTGYWEAYSNEHTPRMRIVDAVRISMSLPLFFRAVRNVRDDVLVDGGLLNNYPVKLFDRQKYVSNAAHRREPNYYADHNKTLQKQGLNISPYVYNRETLGFRLDSGTEIGVFRDGAEPVHRKIADFGDYIWALLQTLIDLQNSQHIHSDDWQRTIYIDTADVKATDFDLSKKTKKDLVKAGRQGTENYFKNWYDNPRKSPVNRP